MSEIIASVYRKIQEGCPEGILFIDEINCVSETLAPTMLQFFAVQDLWQSGRACGLGDRGGRQPTGI